MSFSNCAAFSAFNSTPQAGIDRERCFHPVALRYALIGILKWQRNKCEVRFLVNPSHGSQTAVASPRGLNEHSDNALTPSHQHAGPAYS